MSFFSKYHDYVLNENSEEETQPQDQQGQEGTSEEQSQGEENREENPEGEQQQEEPTEEEKNNEKMAAYDKLVYFDKFQRLRKLLDNFLKLINKNKFKHIQVSNINEKNKKKCVIDKNEENTIEELNNVVQSTQEQIDFILTNGFVNLDNEKISKIFNALIKKIQLSFESYENLIRNKDEEKLK